jgi:sporulation protein YlmC with PRC-barrel domain
MENQKMFTKMLAAALLGTTLLVGSAVAQTPTTSASAKSATNNDQGQWRSSKLIGVEVYNKANEKLGSIEDLVISTNGNIGSVIVGVGGFLGVGEHSVSVSFDKLTWVNEAVRTTTSSNTSSAATPATAVNGASSTTTGMSTTTTTTTARTERAADEKWYPDHAVFDATKDQLKAMPTFKW